jgi:hypothetical protein
MGEGLKGEVGVYSKLFCQANISSNPSLMSTTDINISLETHLLHGLNLIAPTLPHQLTNDLAQYLVDPPPLTIPYKTLFAISQWTRTTDGQKALQARSLNPHDYSMISLLAGTMSSPEGKFGTYIPPKEPEQIGAERANERKSITALINALLSIGGVAFAAWWAADRTGWRNEWVRIITATCQ